MKFLCRNFISVIIFEFLHHADNVNQIPKLGLFKIYLNLKNTCLKMYYQYGILWDRNNSAMTGRLGV